VRAATPSAMFARFRSEMLRVVRNPWFLLLALVFPLGFYLLYTVAGLADGTADRLVGGTAWATYFMVSMAAFGAMSAAVAAGAPVFAAPPPADRTRWRGTAPVPPGGSLLVRATAGFALALLPLSLVGLTGAIVNGVRLSSSEWLDLLGLLWLGVLPFVPLGLLLGDLLHADTAYVAALGIVIVLAILGGLFQPLQTLPATMTALAQLLPSYHLADLGWTVVVGRRPDPVDVLVLAGYGVVLAALLGWRHRRETRRSGG
jgi:ABC-2 type transport system permease protein